MGIRIVVALLVGAAVAQAAPVGTVSVIDRPVARVDDVVVWQSDFDARATQVDPKDKPQLLDQIIDETLAVAEAIKQKIDVDKTEVAAALDEIKSQNKLDDAGLDAALKQVGYTRPRYEKELERQLLRLRAQNQLVAPRVLVTDADVTAEAKVRGVKLPLESKDAETIKRDLRRKAIDAETTAWLADLRKRAWIEKRMPPPAKGTPIKWTELTGKVKAVRVDGASDSQRKELETLLAAAKGNPLDDRTSDLPEKMMHVAGVAEVTLSGAQVKDGIELRADVKPQPVLKKLTAIEKGGKAIALGIAGPPTGIPLDPLRIQTLASTLRSRYLENGFYDVAVTWRADPAPGGVDVTVEVTPGVASTIGGVSFKGATQAAKTLEAQVAKYLVAGEPVTSEKIEVSALTLSAYYWDLGYANVKVQSPKPAPGRNVLVFEITEGPQFRISTVNITGVPTADHAKYKKLFGVKPGDLFSRTAAADGRTRVSDALIAAGKQDVNVLPLTKVDLPNKHISFTLEISFRP
jgi:parvulin-like peptidyl-prolyl isomerase